MAPTLLVLSNAPTTTTTAVNTTQPNTDTVSRPLVPDNTTSTPGVYLAPEAPEETNEAEEAEDEDVPPGMAPPTTTTDGSGGEEVAHDEVADSLQALEDVVHMQDNTGNDGNSDTDTSTSDGSTKTNSHVSSYDGVSWVNLPMNAKAAAMTLGHDEQSWDFGNKIESDYLTWDQLTPEDQMAATILGYAQAQWDAKVLVTPGTNNSDESDGDSNSDNGHHSSWSETPATTNTDEDGSATDTDANAEESSTGEMTTDYLSMTWEELPDAQKTAAADLGYDQTKWGQDAIVFSKYLRWNQMTFDLRQAAKTLGYRQITWNDAVIAKQEEANDTASTTIFGNPLGTATTDDSDAEAATTSTSNIASVDRGRRPQRLDSSSDSDVRVVNLEPQMDSMKSEMDELKDELKTALDMIQVHEQILRVLAGLDPDAPVGTVQQLVAVRQKKNRKNRGQSRAQRKQGQLVKPVEAAPASNREDKNA